MFPTPCPKKRVSSAPGNPLPIPLKGWGGVPAAPWPVYEAKLAGGQVVVGEQHARQLYDNGFFGHGTLSNRGITYEIFSKKFTLSQQRRKEDWREKAEHQGQTHKSPSCIPAKSVYRVPDNGALQASESEAAGELCRDPYPIAEALVLLPEEAVFLCWALGCLVVEDEKGAMLTVESLWSKLLARDRDLMYRYPVYHRLRADGWVVRQAGRYSADYMLYPVGPPYYHAPYLVRVEAHDAASCSPVGRRGTTRSRLLNTLDRSASSVQKMFVLCVVLVPPSLPVTPPIPELLSRVRVEQLPFTWWNLESADPQNPEDSFEE